MESAEDAGKIEGSAPPEVPVLIVVVSLILVVVTVIVEVLVVVRFD